MKRKIFTENGNSIVFEIDNGEAKLTYCDIPSLSEQKLKDFFLRAEQEVYIGVMLGLDKMLDEPFLRHTLLKNNIKWHDDINADELYVIIGNELTANDYNIIQQLADRWNEAKIFTCDGFEDFVLRGGGNCAADKDKIALLQHCIFVEEGYFKWPHTDFLPGQNPLSDNVFQNGTGVLQAMGYQVGKSSPLSEYQRRVILRRTYENNLPQIQNTAYMLEWNVPRTPWRLQKIANCLASFAVNHMRHRNADSFKQAITDWIDDLAWLKENFYDGIYDHPRKFDWPEIKKDHYDGY